MSLPGQAVVDRAAALGVDLTGETGRKLSDFLDLLLAENTRFNLTAITEREQAWSRHIVDSLTLIPWLQDVKAGATLLDVGAGGGLPGIPLAVVRSDLAVTLLEATGKKAAFLTQAARTLALGNVTVVNARAERAAHTRARERFDVVTARALSRLPTLLELTLPFLKVGGRLLAIKGEQAALEVDEAARALSVLGGSVVASTRTETGTLLRIDKVRPTPTRYPRRDGEPKRSPLR